MWLQATTKASGIFAQLDGLEFRYEAEDSRSTWTIDDPAHGRFVIADGMEDQCSIITHDGNDLFTEVIPRPYGSLMGLADAQSHIHRAISGTIERHDVGGGAHLRFRCEPDVCIELKVNHLGFITHKIVGNGGIERGEIRLEQISSSAHS